MTKQFRVAVVGATGAVGEALLQCLHERKFPISRLDVVASERSAGTEVDFGRKQLVVQDVAGYDFSSTDIALFSAGASVSAEHAIRAAEQGCVVIDNTSHFRRDESVPLVVAEVNPHALAGYQERNIIANPNCSTMQMLVALAPIHRKFGISRINVATYQSVSGAGRSAAEELGQQTAAMLRFQSVKPSKFPVQIAFNVIPHIDSFQDNGYTREEMKMVWETHRILEDDSIGVNPTAVRVPVFYGHSEAVHLETRSPATVEQVRQLMIEAPGVELVDERKESGYPTPVTHAAGRDPVFVGRIRKDLSHSNGVNLWIVSDNIRKGAALNAVQIAELLVNHHL
ncbi:MAG: aspartate-semialdehyde dehydrogenase [Lysobacteraceae bacterium]|nr:MAG: aspartate-semialdehyde dehydrogenase [Xanthomonadaceae bacterium]